MSDSKLIITQYSNKILDVDILRYVIMIVTSVFIGYTLQPVPKWLNSLFDNSHIFKFIIMVLMAMVALYPLDDNEVKYIFIGSLLSIVIFIIFRKIGEKDEEKKKTS